MKRRLFLYSFLYLVFLCLSTEVNAQIDITGRVVDSKSGSVLSGVQISINNTTVQALSDNSGFFKIKAQVTLPCTLHFSIEDYEPGEYVIEKNVDDEEFPLDKIVILEENIEILEEPDPVDEVGQKKGETVKLKVSGKVYEKNTKEPLVGANIVVKGTTIGTAAGNKGDFELKANIDLPCVLRVSMIGFKVQEIKISKNYKNLDFYLSTESILGKEVVVRAAEIEVEHRNFTQIVSMETMDALMIRESASANFYQALSNLKGVDVVMQSMNFMTVNARGFNSTENTRFVQVVDGMDNMAPGMNFPIGNIAGLSELDVESMEFIPGPAEVQYGGNALNGILKMNGKDPFKFQGVSFLLKGGFSDVQPGTDHPFQFSAKPQIESAVRIAKAYNDKFAFKINASYSQGRDWYADDTTNIRPGNISWELDPGHDAINKYGDEVTSDLAIGSGGTNVIVSRTGYRDKNLVDNEANNLKLNGSVHYKFTDKVTGVLQGNYGSATTAYTGDNRISLSGFKIYQGKAEVNGEHFLLRGYASKQNSGESYDAKFLAVNLNNEARSDEDWFNDYYYAYTGRLYKNGIPSYDHVEARKYADRYRLETGTAEFEEAKNLMINDPDYTKGAGIYNNSALYNVDGMLDLNRWIHNSNIRVGGNYRFFDLDSRGSIFPDTTGNAITFFEYGAFIEASRELLDEHLQLKASARYDKSENFKGHVSPRFSALYTIDESNNLRVSVLTGFRNPGVKEQFINKDLGTARYLGGLNNVNSSYLIPLNSIYLDNVNEFNEAVNADIIDEKNPYNLEQAIANNLDILEAGIVQEEDMKELVPEQVISFEIGYKTRIKKALYLDAVYYNSIYNDFIGIAKVVKPRTSPQVSMLTAATQVNKSAQSDQYYVNVNSGERIGIQGVALGYKWLMPMGSVLSGNLAWADIRTDVDDPVAPGFNTPGFKSNLSLQNRKMDQMENNPGFKNVGFKITWRYQSRFYWESPFGDGWVEPVSTFDIQSSININKPKAVLKFGASNIFNNKFTYSFGGPNIGVMFYASVVIDNLF